MSVEEALNIVIRALEENTSCGRLGEQVRKAKLILHSYVIDKLVEDKEKEEQNARVG